MAAMGEWRDRMCCSKLKCASPFISICSSLYLYEGYTNSTNLGAQYSKPSLIKLRGRFVQISDSLCYKFEDGIHITTRDAILNTGPIKIHIKCT